MTDSKRLMVKFAAADDPQEKAERISKLIGERSVKAARQLFPDDPDAELASIFEVILDDTASLAEAKRTLDHEEDVEYCHEPAEKRPM